MKPNALLVIGLLVSPLLLVACGEGTPQETAATETSTAEVAQAEPVQEAQRLSADIEAAEPEPAAASAEPAMTETVEAPADAVREPGPLRVVVSIPTLLWPIESMLGEEDEIVSIMQPREDAHGMELTPEDIRAIDRADLVVLVGLGLDGQIERAVKNRPSAFRDVVLLSDVALESGQLTLHGDAHDHDHSHDHDHDHGHSHEDPHLWLVPAIMQVYAETIGQRLEDAYKRADLLEEPVMLRIGEMWGTTSDQAAIADLSLGTRMEPFMGMGIVTNHSAFNLFLERYGIEEYATLQPYHGVEPTPGDIQRVVDAIREHDLKAIIAVPAHDMSSVERVAEMTGVEIIEFDPIGEGNWPVLMDQWYIALHTALTGEAPGPGH